MHAFCVLCINTVIHTLHFALKTYVFSGIATGIEEVARTSITAFTQRLSQTSICSMRVNDNNGGTLADSPHCSF